MLPLPLKAKLEKQASRQAKTFGELVRQILDKYIVGQSLSKETDPFLSSQTVFEDHGSSGPRDVSEKHDHYLAKRGAH